jgi:hypothetical protein
MGMVIWHYSDPGQYLELPYIPTETEVNRDAQWVEFMPPGLSSGFVQFTQGGLYKYRISNYLLNQVGVSTRSVPMSSNRPGNFGGPQSGDSSQAAGADGMLTEKTYVAAAIEFLEKCRKPVMDGATGLQSGPPILLVSFGGELPKAVVLTNFGYTVILRYYGPEMSRWGEVLRATCTMEFTEYNEIPVIGPLEFPKGFL